MSPPNTLYSALLMIAGTICLLVAVMILQTRRNATGSTALMILLLALAWWDITYGIFWANTPGPAKYFWLDITYLGAVTVPTAFFIFSLRLSKFDSWLKRPLAISFYVEPIFVLIMLFTDPYHGLFFAGKRVENSAIILDAGPVFWLNVVYSYALILISTLLLVRTYLHSSGIFRSQVGVVLLGLSITWLNSIIFVLGLNPLPGADNTPFSFTVTAVAFAYGMGKYHLLDIVPVARDILIEKMTDGVMVIDSQNRIVDINPTAVQLLKIHENVIGKPVLQVFQKSNHHRKDQPAFSDPQTEIELGGKIKTYLDMRVSPITNEKGKDLGHLIVLHDITKLKKTQHELHLLATKDALTGAVNRGHFMELAQEEIQRAKRYKRHLSLILMDMDYFKKVNDRYGHEGGDHALIALKNICMHNSRKIDIFARLGGEEFALLLPETSVKVSARLAERLRIILEKTEIMCNTSKFHTTISMGVTELAIDGDDTLEKLLHRADRSMYRAKADGRNRIVVWHPKLG